VGVGVGGAGLGRRGGLEAGGSSRGAIGVWWRELPLRAQQVKPDHPPAPPDDADKLTSCIRSQHSGSMYVVTKLARLRRGVASRLRKPCVVFEVVHPLMRAARRRCSA